MVTLKDFKELIDLTELIKKLNVQGLSPATSTNYSLRSKVNPHTFFVSESGLDKSKFELNNLLWIDDEKKFIQNIDQEKKLSAETDIHLFLYKENPQIGAILHTHSLNSTILSLKHVQAAHLSFDGLEILKAFEGVDTHHTQVTIPIVYNSQNMSEIINEVKPQLRETTKGFLIAGHGLYVWGANLFQAKRHLETFEFLFNYKIMTDKK